MFTLLPGGVTYALTGQGAVRATAPSAHEISHSAARSGAVSRWAVKLDFVGADGTVWNGPKKRDQ